MSGKTVALILFILVPLLSASQVDAVQNKACVERFKELDDLPTERQKDSGWAEVMSTCRAESEAGNPGAMNAVGDMLQWGPPKAPAEDDEQRFCSTSGLLNWGFRKLSRTLVGCTRMARVRQKTSIKPFFG